MISAHNDASKAYNLTAIVASLNSPMDFSMYIQNFTHQVCAALACWESKQQGANSSALKTVARLMPTNVVRMLGCWRPEPVASMLSLACYMCTLRLQHGGIKQVHVVVGRLGQYDLLL